MSGNKDSQLSSGYSAQVTKTYNAMSCYFTIDEWDKMILNICLFHWYLKKTEWQSNEMYLYEAKLYKMCCRVYDSKKKSAS